MEEKQEVTEDIYANVDLSENELTEKKLMLMDCELKKLESDIDLKEMEMQLDSQIPKKFLNDDILRLEKNIADKKTNDGRDATEADLEYMNIRLQFLKTTAENDIPMKKIRFEMQKLIYAKNRPDAPEKQIHKLEKEIRERRATILKTRVPKIPNMTG